MELAQRKTRFALGAALTFLPFVLWIVLPVALFERTATFVHLDERLLEDYAFIVGAAFELPAIYFLERARRRPWDSLSICAFATGVLSILSIFVFFGAAAAITLQGW